MKMLGVGSLADNPHFSPYERVSVSTDMVYKLRDDGKTFGEIARILNCSRHVVSSKIRRRKK
jgi:hypothetical protein